MYIQWNTTQPYKRNEIGSFVVVWMNLESVIWSEVNQEKNKYHTSAHIYELIHIVVRQKLTQHCKASILQFKKN